MFAFRNVMIASAAQIKVDTVTTWVKANDSAVNICYKDTGNITPYPQPIGFNQAKECIFARMRDFTFNDDTLVIVIENYVHKVSTTGKYIDMCAVYMKSAHTSSWSRGLGGRVHVPDHIVPQNDVTVGQMIAESDKSVDPQNWFDRETQITHSLCDAYQSYQHLPFVTKELVTFPDFPKPGVSFQDIFSLMTVTYGTYTVLSALAYQAKAHLLTYDRISRGGTIHDVFIAGLESRGLALGMMLAARLNVPFVPIRKAGKLPGTTISTEYTKEYGSDVFAVQTNQCDALPHYCIVVDDIIATGGSMVAACSLIERMPHKPEVTLVLSLLQVKELKDLWTTAL